MLSVLCRRTAKFQVRQYQPFLVAQTDLDNLPSSSSSSSSNDAGGINPASAGMKAFNALAKYIFGGNAAGRSGKKGGGCHLHACWGWEGGRTDLLVARVLVPRQWFGLVSADQLVWGGL